MRVLSAELRCREPTKSVWRNCTKERSSMTHKQCFFLACAHGFGKYGLPVDQAKCLVFLRQSTGLGFPIAHYELGVYYSTGDMGLEQNEEAVLSHWKEAAEGGNLIARHNLGSTAGRNFDLVAAMRHLRLAASGGYRISMDCLINYFTLGLLHHGNLAEILQVMYRSGAEMRSGDRDAHIKYLKETGEWYRRNYVGQLY